MKKFIPAVALLILFTLLLSGLLAQLAEASPGWWDTDWSCRKEISISNSLALALTDYQVKINISCESAMQSDFDDLRFTNASDTPLDYWIESKTDGSSAAVWVEVDSIVASGNTTIYMYYGNPTAGSASDGTATFLFFDDFSGDLSKWERQSISGVYPRIESGYLRCGGGTTSPPHGWTCLGSRPTYTGFRDNAVEFRYRVATDAICEVSFRGNYASNTGYKGRSDQRSGEGQSFLKPPYSGWLLITSRDGDRPSVGIWYRGTITASGSIFNLYRDGVLKRSVSDSQYSGPGQISLQNHHGSYTDYDWVAVRKFTSPEPTYSIGSEESLPTVTIDISDTLINEADDGDTLDAVATFSKAMDTTVTPTISFSPDVEASGTLTFFSDAWSDGDTVYTATYDVADVDEEEANVDVSVGGAEDLAGNPQNPDPTTETALFDVDTIAPTVDITSTATDPTATSPIPMTATFSDDVTGFELEDITVGNGAADNFVAVSDAEYTFDVTPVTDGLVTVDIAAGVTQDDANNDNAAAVQFTIAYDATGQTGGSTKDRYTTKDDVLVTANGFLPDSDVDVYVVNDRAWTDGDPIPADVGDGMDAIQADSGGNIGPQVIWSHQLELGEYDIVFDAGQDGFYNALWDLVDHPNHPGFTVVSPTVGGKVYPINKTAVIMPWVGLALVLILAAGGGALTLRNRRNQ